MKKLQVLFISAALIAALFAGYFFIKRLSVSSGRDRQSSVLLKSATELMSAGKLTEAKKICEELIANHSDSMLVKDAQKLIGTLNMAILLSPTLAGGDVSYEVKLGDTLSDIAKKYNTTVELLKRSNNLTSDTLRPGMRLKIHTGKFSVVVDKTQNTLTLKSKEDVFKVYPISTGKEASITPAGNFKIVNKLPNPTWYTEGQTIPYGDPRNILGTRWMGLDNPGYGIHGTTEPESIGKSVTAGCVRMYNKDVEELYDILPAGTEVTILN
ncbi:MAG: L,D-transpeptidase family protein [Candidatus Omnitrophota bacterium]